MKKALLILAFTACALTAYSAALTSSDCLSLSGTICFQDKNTYISKDNLPSDVVGLWTFDDSKGIDSSGYNNHLVTAHTPGPAYGGKGYSARFDSSNNVQINFDSFAYSQFTISFWIFLNETATGTWRSVFRKGSSLSEYTPTLQLWPSENRLHVLVDTDANIKESLDSKGLLTVRRWTNIGLIFSEKLIQIFINGQLDSQKILDGALVHNTGPLYIGDDPYITAEYFMSIQKSTLNVYGSAPFATLGCSACSYYEAVNACPTGYHLCSNQELYAGAYWTARVNGWFGGRDVWRRAPTVNNTASLSGDMLDPYASKPCINSIGLLG